MSIAIVKPFTTLYYLTYFVFLFIVNVPDFSLGILIHQWTKHLHHVIEILKHYHGSLHITQTDKTALILMQWHTTYINGAKLCKWFYLPLSHVLLRVDQHLGNRCINGMAAIILWHSIMFSNLQWYSAIITSVFWTYNDRCFLDNRSFCLVYIYVHD